MMDEAEPPASIEGRRSAPTRIHIRKPSALFDRAAIERYLTDLAEAINRRDVAARIELIGGAAMALVHYEERPLTSDVDSSLHPKDLVMEEAVAIAEREGLPQSWLNDAAAMFLPPDPPEFIEVMRRGKVVVSVAPPGLLLAMKLRACRAEKDFEDIAILLRTCDVRSLSEAEAHLAEVFPEEDMPASGPELITAALGEVVLDTESGQVLLAVKPRPPPTTCGRHVWWADAVCTLFPNHAGDCEVPGKPKPGER